MLLLRLWHLCSREMEEGEKEGVARMEGPAEMQNTHDRGNLELQVPNGNGASPRVVHSSQQDDGSSG